MHELTHMIQFRAIINVDPYQLSKLTSGKESQEERKTSEYREKYIQNMIEFDPSLKTAIYKFKSNYDKKIKTLTDFKKYFNDFTLKEDLGKDNDFFRILFNKNILRWKKAVKILYVYLIQNDYNKLK